MTKRCLALAAGAILAGCAAGSAPLVDSSDASKPRPVDAAVGAPVEAAGAASDAALPGADSQGDSSAVAVLDASGSTPGNPLATGDSGLVMDATNGPAEAGAVGCGAASTAARGATLPYQEYEAENGITSGTRIGPSRSVNDPDLFRSIAGESSGRMAVKLTTSGQFVQFKTRCAANALVLRYVIPDSSDGSGQEASLGLYVNGARVQSLTLTSHYAWAYGNPQTSTTTTNNPGDGYARHFYDEVRTLLTSEIPPDATVSLQKDPSDTAPYYIIDLVDLEEVSAPLSRPANSLSITDYGATPNDASDDGLWIRNCLHDAQTQGKSVWIPPGVFIDGSMAPSFQNLKVQGAGMWYSTLRGAAAHFNCGGTGCQLSDLALSGEVTARDDGNSIHAVSGAFGTGSRLDNVWLEHFTTGPWIGATGGTTTGLVVHGCRFRDLFADGINLTDGTSNAIVEQTQARNTGDDAFASWAIGSSAPNTGNTFRFDTAQVPWRANCYAIYGGTNNAIEDSVCADTVTYPGILIEQGFQSHSFAGTTSVARDTIVRSGGNAYGAKWGALTVMGFEVSAPITGLQVQDVDIADSTFSGIFLVGPKDAINGLSLSRVTIQKPGTYGIEVDPTAVGSAAAANVVVVNPGASSGLNNQAPASFSFMRGPGNTGW